MMVKEKRKSLVDQLSPKKRGSKVTGYLEQLSTQSNCTAISNG